MKQISNKEYEKYQQYQTDKLYGRILTPDGLRVVCAGLDNDPGFCSDRDSKSEQAGVLARCCLQKTVI